MGERGLTSRQFYKDLKASQSLSEDEAWVEFYRHYWGPELLSVHGISGSNEWQRHGVDKLLYFANGKCLSVDEKKRAHDYGDFLAEIWSPYYGSKDPRNREGWTVNASKVCDFVAYGPSGGVYYLLPFEILRLTTRREYLKWTERITRRDFTDAGYKTINRSVSWNELFKAMRRTQEARGMEKLKLQRCGSVRGQEWFGFMKG
jgi:hypothetical protein